MLYGLFSFQEEAKHKSRKEIMEEVVAKAKLKKVVLAFLFSTEHPLAATPFYWQFPPTNF